MHGLWQSGHGAVQTHGWQACVLPYLLRETPPETGKQLQLRCWTRESQVLGKILKLRMRATRVFEA
jgi:hypothetical protein